MNFVPKKSIRALAWGTLAVVIGISCGSFLLSAFRAGGAAEPAHSNLVANASAPETPKQKYFYTNKSGDNMPAVSAQAYLVGDLDTGEVIVSKNQDKKFPIASVSKLMTALVSAELAAPDASVTVSKHAVATLGSNGELRTGEKIRAAELLYPLLLESSNDAAEALADFFGRDDFLSRMNAEAARLGMASTSYDDPSGLSAKNQSTVADLFKLTGYIRDIHGEIFDITTKRSRSAPRHNWSNISQFLGTPGYAGGKSGYTDAASETVVSLFNLPLSKSGSRPIAITLLKSRDREKDVKRILAYLAKNVYYGGRGDAKEDWVKEKTGLPPVWEPDFVTFSFMGDIMLDRGVRSSVIKNFGSDYSTLFAKLPSKFLKDADIAFANLEGPVSDQGTDQKNLYSFRMDPGVIPALKGAGLDIVSVANNHVGDWGRVAYADTLARLKENEVVYTGGGATETEAEIPEIVEKHGIKTGFLGFSDVGPSWMEATGDQAGLLLANDPRFDEIIQNAARQVDFLVVSFHWGDEYKTTHTARQEYLAHRAIDLGAKLVIGHHPHVPEDTETYKNGFIAYSLGNFIFDQSWSKATMQGLLLQVKLWKDGSLSITKNTTYQNSVFQLDHVTEGKEEKIKFEEVTL